MKIELALARFFSVVFHPLFMPSLGLLLLFYLEAYISMSIPLQARRLLLLIVFVNTAIAPALAILLLKKTGLVDNVQLDKRSERMLPLLITALFFFLTFFLLKKVALPSLIYFYVLGATLLVLLCLIVTFRYKISIHSTSLGGFTGFLLTASWFLGVDWSGLIMAAFLLSGIVGASRIRLNAHTPMQVYSGYLMGLGVMLLLFIYLRGG